MKQTEVAQMKKTIAIILSICFLISLCGCSKEKTKITDYQYMYDGIVKDWNKAATPGHEREDLFGYGQYLYNSYLLLFPRETPSSLNEFYFHWTQSIDVDGYAIYFTSKLSEDNYLAFTKGLDNFNLQHNDETIGLLYDNTHFSLPTYVLQWSKVDQKWEVLEYIMLDEKNHTVVFVYTMGELEYIEEHSTYTVTPSELHFLNEDFSIYEDFENSTYDISFLEYLK